LIVQKWLYSTQTIICKKINHFFGKKFFHKNHLWGALAKFFEKILLLENALCGTPFDAVLRADYEYRLGLPLRCYFKDKKKLFGIKNRGVLRNLA
jgi:hypothetical protein